MIALTMDNLIKLTVKTPNQRIEDIQIDCDLKWTVRKLKEYLQDVYPSNPSSSSQKLIYLGRLLQDHLSLKEVFGEWGGQALHIVCAESNKPAATRQPVTSTMAASSANNSVSEVQTNNASEGLRQRRPTNVETPATNTEYLPTYQVPPPTTADSNAFQQSHTPTTNIGQLSGLTPQQQHQYQLQMQQYYQQLHQWHLLMSTQWPYNQMPMMQTFNTPSSPTTPSSPSTPPSPQSEQRPPHAVNPPAGNNPPPAAIPEPAANAPPAEDNAPMNAGPGPLQDDGGQNRDWLDWVYMSMRMVMLFSIVYFYSSTSRFFMVSLLAFIVYLYQTGWFTPQRAQVFPIIDQQPDQTNDNSAQSNDLNNAQPNDDSVVVDSNGQNFESENSEQANNESENIEQPLQQQTPSVGFVRLIWTFCLAFVGSLIPTAPQRPVPP